jgi:predicted O-methyltransferase YrrM
MKFTHEVIDYAEKHTSGESEVLKALREHCYAHYDDRSMLSGFFQGRLLAMISRMVRPMYVQEVGTYLGYSAICLAEGLQHGGMVYSMDNNPETNAVAQSFIDKAGLSEQITLRLGDAIYMLPHLAGPFDIVFIDADKPNYANYYDLIIDKMSPGGFIIADNVLWSGKVLNPKDDENAKALDAFNQKVLADDRVSNVLLPVRDGLMVVCKS